MCECVRSGVPATLSLLSEREKTPAAEMMSRNDNGGGYYMTHGTVGRRCRKIKLRSGQVEPLEPRHTHHKATDVCGLIKYEQQ